MYEGGRQQVGSPQELSTAGVTADKQEKGQGHTGATSMGAFVFL